MEKQTVAEQLLAYDWDWRSFAENSPMLFTQGGGAKVVLSTDVRTGKLLVRNDEGTLRPITSDHSLALLFKAIPAMVEVLNDLKRSDDRPRQLKMIEAALELAGNPNP